jgi:hypothetical protein
MWEAVGLQRYGNHNENDYALHSIKFHARALFLHSVYGRVIVVVHYIITLRFA